MLASSRGTALVASLLGAKIERIGGISHTQMRARFGYVAGPVIRLTTNHVDPLLLETLFTVAEVDRRNDCAVFAR